MVLIRKLRESDFEEYCKNELSYYNELKADPSFGIGTFGKRVTRKTASADFRKLFEGIKRGRTLVLVGESEGHLIGAAYAFGHAWFEAPHVVEIGVSVVKEYRGKGIGTALVKALIKKCRAKYEIATASLFSSNVASKRMFSKMGFKVWGRGPNFVKRGKIYLDSELLYSKLR